APGRGAPPGVHRPRQAAIPGRALPGGLGVRPARPLTGPCRRCTFLIHGFFLFRPRRSVPRAVMDTPRRILVVEDHPDSRDMLRLVLELWGHQVEVAADGGAGLERARSCRPDVALVDIGLPGMAGYEVARRLRDDLGPAVRLIALTAY